MLSNSQPFPASYKWVLAEGADPSVWSVTPASGQLGGPSTEEVTVRWNPKPNTAPGETEVSPDPLSPTPLCNVALTLTPPLPLSPGPSPVLSSFAGRLWTGVWLFKQDCDVGCVQLKNV